MELDLNTRRCQDTENYDDCKTWFYIKNLRQECGCLPLNLRLSTKVKKVFIKINITFYLHTQDALCETETEKMCFGRMRSINSTFCMR